MSVTFGSPEEETLQALTESLELEDSHTQKVREAILALARSQRGAHDLGVSHFDFKEYVARPRRSDAHRCRWAMRFG